MKNLSQMQTELKTMQQQLQSLIGEMERLKSEEKTEKESEYRKVALLAKKYPIENMELRTQNELTKRLYFTLLTTMAGIEGSYSKEALVFMQRIAYGCRWEEEISTMIRRSMETDMRFWEDVSEMLPPVKESLILDLMMMAGISGVTEKAMQLIAEIANLLGASTEDIRILSLLSKALLEMDEGAFSEILPTTEPNKWEGRFWHYIPKTWIENARQYVFNGIFLDSGERNRKIVKKGEIIRGRKLDGEIVKEIAPQNGILFVGSFEPIEIEKQDKKPSESSLGGIFNALMSGLIGKKAYVVSCFDCYEEWKKLGKQQEEDECFYV